MPHICVCKLSTHWFRLWLVTCVAPSHYLNQCWLIVNWTFNSLAPGKPGYHFKTVIFNLVFFIGIFTSSNDNPPRWMPCALTNDKSTLVQVMAWCHQATSHYLSQCWPSSMSPYGVTRPQYVKNKFQWNLNQNTKLLIHENIFEIVLCQMASTLSRGR